MNRFVTTCYLILFTSVSMAQNADFEDLTYANLSDDISELAFNETGQYLGIMSKRYLVVFNADNTIRSKLDLLEVSEGTFGNWFLIRKIAFSRDTISIDNINSIQTFIIKEDSISMLKSLRRSTHSDRLFDYKSKKSSKMSMRNNYLGKHNGWDFGYMDLSKSPRKIKPEIWLHKNGIFKKHELPEITFNYDSEQLWKKDWAVVSAVFDNHFEIGKNNIYFSFPFHDKLVIFNTVDGSYSEVAIPKTQASDIWYTYIDPFSKIPYLIIENSDGYGIYYLNKKLEFVFLTISTEKPAGIVDHKIYLIRQLKEGDKSYSAHFLKRINAN